MHAKKHDLMNALGHAAATLILGTAVRWHVAVDDLVLGKRGIHTFKGAYGDAVEGATREVNAVYPDALAVLAAQWFIECGRCGNPYPDLTSLTECQVCHRTRGCWACLRDTCTDCLAAAEVKKAEAAASLPPDAYVRDPDTGAVVNPEPLPKTARGVRVRT